MQKGVWLNLSFSFNQIAVFFSGTTFGPQWVEFFSFSFFFCVCMCVLFHLFINLLFTLSYQNLWGFFFFVLLLWDWFVIEIALEDHSLLILSHSFPASASQENSNYTCRLLASLGCAGKVFASRKKAGFNQEEDAESDCQEGRLLNSSLTWSSLVKLVVRQQKSMVTKAELTLRMVLGQ